MRNPFKPKPKPIPFVVYPIRISGLYTICGRLGLPKAGDPPEHARRFVAEMTSGKDAIFKWSGSERAHNVDWDWHDFAFERYATPEEAAKLPRYC